MALQPYTRTIYHPQGPESVGSQRIHQPAGGGWGGRTAPATSGSATDPAAMSAIQKAIAHYQPGGGFGKGTEAALERGRTKAVAGGMQGLVSAGLAGTTMMGGLGKKYEEEVAGPMRARVEETRVGAISGLEMMKAQIIQGATEAQRSRALQTYLAQLQQGTSMSLAAMNQPTSIAPTRTPAPTVSPQRDAGGYGTVDVDKPYHVAAGGGFSPYASAGYGLHAGGYKSLYASS